MEIYIAHTQGFCAGVARAIEIVDQALKRYGIPLFVFHDIVHNTFVVEDFRQKGVAFIDDLNDVPDGAHLIFSAHGVSPEIVNQAKEKKLFVIDATCPLVERVHHHAKRLSDQNVNVILIGHKKHQEIIGTQGYVDPSLLHIVEDAEDVKHLNLDPQQQIGYVTQTTLSRDDAHTLIEKLKIRFPRLILQEKDGICYATQNRQNAVKELCRFCDAIIICGSANSSNSNRLVEIAQASGIESFLADDATEINFGRLSNKKKIGISSGASVPAYITDEVISVIQKRFDVIKIHKTESPEKEIAFSLPSI